MAVLQIKGLDEYAKKIKTLSKNADSVMKRVVYDGGAVIADAVKAGLKELPVEETLLTVWDLHPYRNLSRDI